MGRRRGLKGKTGFVSPGLHIASNYDCNDMLFVEVNEGGGIWWKRESKEDAKRNNSVVISCAHCDNPATSLDHYWPYHSEMNSCDEHLNKRGE